MQRLHTPEIVGSNPTTSTNALVVQRIRIRRYERHGGGSIPSEGSKQCGYGVVGNARACQA